MRILFEQLPGRTGGRLLGAILIVAERSAMIARVGWDMKRIAFGSAAVVTLAMLAAAGKPAALAGTSAGLWEVSGLPGGRVVRQCIANTRLLAQFEHRREFCPQTVMANRAISP